MSWTTYINGFHNYLLIEKSLSKNTVDAYIRDIRKLANFFLNKDEKIKINDISYQDFQVYIAYLNEETPIASSLSFVEDIDGKITTLYGRYWGALNNISNLHFEVAYYALIEWCIKHGVQTFEGGAQGEHKLARGFEPIITHSIHWISNSRFRTPIRSFLNNEDQYIDSYLETLKLRTPFKNES